MMKAKLETASTTAPGDNAPAIFNETEKVTVPPGVNLGIAGISNGLEIPPAVTDVLTAQAKAILANEPETKVQLWAAIENRLLLSEAAMLVQARWTTQLQNERVEEARQRRDAVIKSAHFAFKDVAIDLAEELLYFFTTRLGMRLEKQCLAGPAGHDPTWQRDTEHSTISIENFLGFLQRQAKETPLLDPDFYRLALSGCSPMVTVLMGDPADLISLSKRFGLATTLSWTDEGGEIRIFGGGAPGFGQRRGGPQANLRLFKSVEILSADGSCGLPWKGSDARWIVSPKQFEQTVKPDAPCELPALPSELFGILRDCAGASPVVLPRALSMMIAEGK
jgi:hypothetical protein